MIILTKKNIPSYIKDHVPSLQLKEPVKVSMIGDGDLGEDVEGDGYCNYVFRISDADGYSVISASKQHLNMYMIDKDGNIIHEIVKNK